MRYERTIRIPATQCEMKTTETDVTTQLAVNSQLSHLTLTHDVRTIVMHHYSITMFHYYYCHRISILEILITIDSKWLISFENV